ncbi:hypothetical protein F4212_01295 [Candidatus Poribacteria bacterium]|nr:hypothetical protein [Candidatus Poribacteria bacterium]
MQTFQDFIQQEREYQDRKWGKQNHPDEKWLAIFVEEVGEMSKAILEKNDVELFEEIVQAAAVLQAWVTSRLFDFSTGEDG